MSGFTATAMRLRPATRRLAGSVTVIQALSELTHTSVPLCSFSVMITSPA